MKHEEIIELLPWYANRTLEENERREVEAHLGGCRECAKEVEHLSALRKAIIEIENQGPTLPTFALNRALAKIEEYELAGAPEVATKESAQPGQGWWSRWWKPTPLFARALIGAQIVLVLAVGTIAIYQYTHPVVIYKTASGSVDDKGRARIVVRFNEGATEQDVRQAVLAIKGKIVDGPSAQSLYTIQLPVAREQNSEIENMLKTLRQNQRVVRSAELMQ